MPGELIEYIKQLMQPNIASKLLVASTVKRLVH